MNNAHQQQLDRMRQQQDEARRQQEREYQRAEAQRAQIAAQQAQFQRQQITWREQQQRLGASDSLRLHFALPNTQQTAKVEPAPHAFENDMPTAKTCRYCGLRRWAACHILFQQP